MAINFKDPQTVLAIILIIAAILGPIFFRERMLWKLDETQDHLRVELNDIQKRLNEAEMKLREREVMYNYLKERYGIKEP